MLPAQLINEHKKLWKEAGGKENKVAIAAIEGLMLYALELFTAGMLPDNVLDLLKGAIEKTGNKPSESSLKEAYFEGWEDRDATRREEVTNAERDWIRSDTIIQINRREINGK